MYVDSTKNKGEKNQNKAERPYLLFLKLSAIKTFVTAGEKKKKDYVTETICVLHCLEYLPGPLNQSLLQDNLDDNKYVL